MSWPRRIAVALVAQAQSIDAEGHYEVGALAPGDYTVRVIASGYAASAEQEAHVPGVADFDLSRGAKLFGTVDDAKSKQPLAGARVELDERMVVGGEAVPMVAGAVTGADGHFEIAGLGPQPQSLSVAAEGHHSRILSGLRGGGGDVGPLLVELTPTEPGEEPRIEYAGIGAQLRAEGDGLTITGVIPGGGAAEAGLAPGDAILAVEGAPVVELGFAGSIQLIRGPEDTVVHLTVRRSGATQVVPVYRRRLRA